MSTFFTEKAEQDLREIKSRSSQIASRIAQEISMIKPIPQEFTLSQEFPGGEKILVCSIDGYRVFYTTNGGDIYVLGVAYRGY